jgi:hypothetical protein
VFGGRRHARRVAPREREREREMAPATRALSRGCEDLH